MTKLKDLFSLSLSEINSSKKTFIVVYVFFGLKCGCSIYHDLAICIKWFLEYHILQSLLFLFSCLFL